MYMQSSDIQVAQFSLWISYAYALQLTLHKMCFFDNLVCLTHWFIVVLECYVAE